MWLFVVQFKINCTRNNLKLNLSSPCGLGQILRFKLLLVQLILNCTLNSPIIYTNTSYLCPEIIAILNVSSICPYLCMRSITLLNHIFQTFCGHFSFFPILWNVSKLQFIYDHILVVLEAWKTYKSVSSVSPKSTSYDGSRDVIYLI